METINFEFYLVTFNNIKADLKHFITLSEAKKYVDEILGTLSITVYISEEVITYVNRYDKSTFRFATITKCKFEDAE